jgi:hypothetical protein
MKVLLPALSGTCLVTISRTGRITGRFIHAWDLSRSPDTKLTEEFYYARPVALHKDGDGMRIEHLPMRNVPGKCQAILYLPKCWSATGELVEETFRAFYPGTYQDVLALGRARFTDVEPTKRDERGASGGSVAAFGWDPCDPPV